VPDVHLECKLVRHCELGIMLSKTNHQQLLLLLLNIYYIDHY